MFTFSGHASNVTWIGFQKDDKWMFSSSEDKSLKNWGTWRAGVLLILSHYCIISFFFFLLMTGD